MAYDYSSAVGIDIAARNNTGTAETRPLAPIGAHSFAILEAEKKMGKSSNMPYINLKLRIDEGQYEDVYGVIALPDGGRKQESNDFLEMNFMAFLDTIGVDRTKAAAVEGNPNGLVLKTGKVVLKMDTYTNPVTGQSREKRQPDWPKSCMLGGSEEAAPAPAAEAPPPAAEPF